MPVQVCPLAPMWTLGVLVSGASNLHPSGHEVSFGVCAIASFDDRQRSILRHRERQQSNCALVLASILLQSREGVHDHCQQ